MQHIRAAKTDHDYLLELGVDIHQQAAAILDEMFATEFEQTAGWYAVVEGTRHMPFDDLHPAMGTFSTDSGFVAIVPGRYATVAAMVEEAQGVFQRYALSAADAAPRDQERFCPHRIRICDRQGKSVLVYDHAGWWDGHTWEMARNAPFVPG